MNLATKVVLLFSNVAVGTVSIMRFLFPTDTAAPITSPYSEGNNSLTFVQVDGEYSIASGRLHMPTQATPTVFNQLGWYQTAGQARVGGRMWKILFNFSTINNSIWFALSSGATMAFDSFANVQMAFSNTGSSGAVAWVFNTVSGGNILSIVANTDYEAALVARPTAGGFMMVRDALVQKYRILFVGATGTGATLRAAQSNASGVADFDNLDEFDILDARWQTQYGLATSYTASPTTGTTVTMQPNALVEFTWTPASAETLDIQIRRVDDNNCWIVRGDQAGSTVKLFEKVAGVETQRGTATMTWTIGTAFRIVIGCYGTAYAVENYTVHVGAALKFTYASGDANFQFATETKVSGFATGSELVTWPLLVDDPYQYPLSTRYFLAYGDSKTLGSGDTTLLPYGYSAFPAILERRLSDATGQKWKETYRLGTSGATVATKAASIAADLALVTDAPEFIFFNLGANDMAGALTEATWKANLRTILDAMRAKWPGAQIYLTRPWRRTFTTSPATLGTWLSDVRAEAAYSSFVYLGDDERVYLENGDNGVTYTGDGLHPNRAGYILKAAATQTVIGL